MSDRRLQVFHAVARLLSFTKAAEVLHMTQPAVTFQIRQLEDQFHTRLFDRTHNRVALTEAGKIMFKYSEQIFRTYGEMEEAVKHATNSSRVVVGVSTFVDNYYGWLVDGNEHVAVSEEPMGTLYLSEKKLELKILGSVPILWGTFNPDNKEEVYTDYGSETQNIVVDKTITMEKARSSIVQGKKGFLPIAVVGGDLDFYNMDKGELTKSFIYIYQKPTGVLTSNEEVFLKQLLEKAL